MMWRGTAGAPPFLSGATLAITGSTSTVKFVAYPIAARGDEPGADQLGGGGDGGGAEPPSLPDLNAEGRLAEALPHFSGWTFDWLDVPGLMSRSAEILEYPMVDRDPLPCWGRGRVTLVGDAAHPVYPIGSNGGSQAIIDARVLARELAAAASRPTALPPTRPSGCPRSTRSSLATRNMPVDQVLDMVAARAPAWFDRIEDVLAPAELAALKDAYRTTSLQDVAALIARPSFLPERAG